MDDSNRFYIGIVMLEFIKQLKVSIFIPNEGDTQKMKRSHAYKQMEQYLKDEVQARQQVNAELGMFTYSRAKGCVTNSASARIKY